MFLMVVVRRRFGGGNIVTVDTRARTIRPATPVVLFVSVGRR